MLEDIPESDPMSNVSEPSCETHLLSERGFLTMLRRFSATCDCCELS